MAIIVTRSVSFRGREIGRLRKVSPLLPAEHRPFATIKGDTVEWTRDDSKVTTIVEATGPDRVSVTGLRRGRLPSDTDELVFRPLTFIGPDINNQGLSCTNRRGFGLSTKISVEYQP